MTAPQPAGPCVPSLPQVQEGGPHHPGAGCAPRCCDRRARRDWGQQLPSARSRRRRACETFTSIKCETSTGPNRYKHILYLVFGILPPATTASRGARLVFQWLCGRQLCRRRGCALAAANAGRAGGSNGSARVVCASEGVQTRHLLVLHCVVHDDVSACTHMYLVHGCCCLRINQVKSHQMYQLAHET